MKKLILSVLSEKFVICKFDSQSKIPDWVKNESCNFLSITKTNEELSIVCDQSMIPNKLLPNEISALVRDWRALKVEGPLDFSLTGILSSLLQALAKHKISIFALSTYDTDYILVKDEDLQNALNVLKKQCIIRNNSENKSIGA